MEGKCVGCKMDFQEEFKGIVFSALEGDPWMCERCLARQWGVDALWKKDVVTEIEESENGKD